jgi:peptidoglycan hydrolase-like protein with peptidoglycan-binding domain
MRPAESFLSQPVRSLQTMLRVLGEDDERLKNVVPDGIYGDQTRNAVYHFQRSHGIPATGVTDQTTWDAIYTEFEPAQTRQLPAQPLQILLEPGQVIRKGEENRYLHVVQAVLISLADSYGSITAPAVTGYLDDPTSDAIASFQYLSGLPQTGELDKVTWKHMAIHYALAANLDGPNRRNRRNDQA